MRAPNIPGVEVRAVGVAVVIKTATVAFLALRGSDYALHQYVAGFAFVPRLEGQPDTMLMMTCLLPTAVLAFAFCGYVPADLTLQAASVMPRLGKRRFWALRRTLGLVVSTAVYVLLGGFLEVVIFIAPGGLQPGEVLPVALAALLLELLSCIVLVLLTNAAALWLEPVVAAALVLGAHGGTLVAQAHLPLSWGAAAAPWLPSVRGVLAWHDAPDVVVGVSGMSLASSCALLSALAFLAGLALVRSVTRCDIL